MSANINLNNIISSGANANGGKTDNFVVDENLIFVVNENGDYISTE